MVVLAAVGQGVGFIDKQHAAHGLIDDLFGFDSGLADITGDQIAAIHLDQLALAEDAQRVENARHQPGDHGFARAGVAGKHHVQRQVALGQAMLLAQLGNFNPVHQLIHLLLHGGQADIAVELLHQVVHGFLGRFLGLGGGIGLAVARGRRGGGGLGRRVRLLGRGRIGLRVGIKIVIHRAQVALGHGLDDFVLQADDFVLTAGIHAAPLWQDWVDGEGRGIRYFLQGRK